MRKMTAILSSSRGKYKRGVFGVVDGYLVRVTQLANIGPQEIPLQHPQDII